jgi:hypothetical protein
VISLIGHGKWTKGVFEVSELHMRILQLEHLLNCRMPQATKDAIQDHISKLQKRLVEIEFESSSNERLGTELAPWSRGISW